MGTLWDLWQEYENSTQMQQIDQQIQQTDSLEERVYALEEALASTVMNCLVDNVNLWTDGCSGSFDPLCIGAHGGMKTNTGTMWNNQLGEVLLFDRQLNATESSDLTAYLKAKWGF